jgi:hypothetical protein
MHRMFKIIKLEILVSVTYLLLPHPWPLNQAALLQKCGMDSKLCELQKLVFQGDEERQWVQFMHSSNVPARPEQYWHLQLCGVWRWRFGARPCLWPQVETWLQQVTLPCENNLWNHWVYYEYVRLWGNLCMKGFGLMLSLSGSVLVFAWREWETQK